eukprot:TRINITY_DN5797_c0_g1_i1.p1 TRINITY_DN5797_c0_g1~~TRINITY_DN5797_c0_g1_i1.p1  ORF type:complete len:423 (+),score=151.03 TRINITY_DN5797_c0_g1_i1:141-1409(+)
MICQRFLVRGKSTTTTIPLSSSTTVAKSIEKYSRYRPTPLSIQRFLDFGRNFTPESSYKFLQLELPVRLAGILKELAFLPSELQSLPHCQEIHAQYVESLEDILRFENSAPEGHKLEEFTEVLKHVYRRHADTVTIMAQAVLMVKESYLSSSASVSKLPKFERNIQYFLNRLYMSRISTRMLINQHVLFTAREDAASISETELVGTIDPCCDILDVLDQAYKNARFLCESYYMNAPEMNVHAQDIHGASKIEIVYVPSHLYHILFELLKNAMRATVEHAEGSNTYDLPPIMVTVVRSKEDVSIKLSDQGGGIPRRLRDKIFHYLYTTADNPVLTTSNQDPASQLSSGVPLAGYGYGLPLSRLYARYFAGDLQIYSCDGFGTDALVYLQAESEHARENLPIYHETGSRKIYEAHLTPNDWTVQ